MRQFEQDNDMIFLGRIGGASRYLPMNADPAFIAHVVDELRGEPMDSAEMRAALFELWLTTKHEKMPAEDRDAMLMVYAKRLADFPAETVQVVLNELSQTSKFFPSWAEIKERLDGMMGWRSDIINALRRATQRQKKEQAK